MFTVGILTVSDRAARGRYEDRSGPALLRLALRRGWRVVAQEIVPDGKAAVRRAVRAMARGGCAVILITGGTGIAARDLTPEAVRGIARCELVGFGEAMRAGSRKLTPHALLSRATAFVVGRSLVICLPGSPKGAVECLGFVAGAIPHAVELLRGPTTAH